MDNKDIYSFVKEYENKYIGEETKTSDYVSFNMHDIINTIYAYLNSKHISGSKDSLGRDKPFFNIVTSAVNIWYRATDIDRKNIKIKPKKKEDVVKAFVFNILLQEYMRKMNFGKVLNTWGRQLASFGSSVWKFTKKDGELIPEIVPWNRLIVDPISFENNPVIEKIELTEAELRKNESYDKEQVENLINTAKEARETISGDKKDTRDNYIKIYEVHGEFPLSLLTGNEEDTEFVQQMHVVSSVQIDKDKVENFTLYSGREENPYVITHLIEEEGQTLAIGAVQHLFEAQWMVNHSQKAIKDQLDLASKLIFQTSDGSFVKRNVLKNIENGDILITKQNQQITQVANSSHDITSLQSFASQWQVLAKEITSTPDAISGNTMPSGTAYRQVAILNRESHSLFEIMIENKGLALEHILRTKIIPHIIKKMDTTKEIAVILEEQDIKKLDSMYIPNEARRRANQKLIERILNGEVVTNEDEVNLVNDEEKNIKEDFSFIGNQRFIKPSDIPSKTWKDEMKGFEWDVEVEISGESSDKATTMETLTTIFNTIVNNPQALQDENTKLLFNKILLATGELSPLELQETTQQAPA